MDNFSISTKRCVRCSHVLKVSEFHRESRNSDGLRADCKSCRNRSERARRALNIDVERTHRRVLYQQKEAALEGISFDAATPGNRREIRRAKRMRWITTSTVPEALHQDLRGGYSVRDRPDKPLSAFEKHQEDRTLDIEANDWLKANDPLFDDRFYEAV